MAELVGKFYALMWRLNYAGYVMRRTRCAYNAAMRQAHEAQELYDWENSRPSDIAASRLALWHKPE